MKYLANPVSAVVAAIILTSLLCCGNKKNPDSEKTAEKENQEEARTTDKAADFDFAVKAADVSAFEIQIGQYAAKNGMSSAVRELGDMMVKDHTAASAELKPLAEKKSVALPASLGEKLQKKYDDLVKKQGAEFDKDYADAMVSGHKETIDAFKTEAESGKDDDFKTWAAGKIPVLEHHLQMAESTRSAVKK